MLGERFKSPVGIESDEVRRYWNTRAIASCGAPTATTDDRYLRRLEAATLVSRMESLRLAAGARVLDIGCGDGNTTLEIARAFPSLRIAGIDYSAEMIRNAGRNLSSSDDLADRVEFYEGDARSLTSSIEPASFDLVVSVRSLINLPSASEQYGSLEQISSVLRPGGRYLAIENFLDGHANLNAARRKMGLSEIPIRWHNLYFDREEFAIRCAAWFDGCEMDDFASGYYYATRVLYSAYAKSCGEQPSYEHEIHRLAVGLPPTGAFSPVRLAILTKGQAGS